MDDKQPLTGTIRFKVASAVGYVAYFVAVALPVYVLMILFVDGVTPETTPILLYLVVFDLLLWVLGRACINFSLGNKLFEGMFSFGRTKKPEDES